MEAINIIDEVTGEVVGKIREVEGGFEALALLPIRYGSYRQRMKSIGIFATLMDAGLEVGYASGLVD